MGKKLNIPPVLLTPGTVTNLLNGAFASLSGPVGFTPEQPRIIVKSIRVVAEGGSNIGSVTLYKGASSATVAGTEVASTGDQVSPGHDAILDMGDLVLDAADFLVASTPGSVSYPNLTLVISAEIEA